MVYYKTASLDELNEAMEWISKRHSEIVIEIPKLFDEINSLNSVLNWRKIRKLNKKVDELMKESSDLVDEAFNIQRQINSIVVEQINVKLDQIFSELDGDEG